MPPYRFKSPAKLNLSLRVTGRRSDGYHLLDSVFALIDFYDFLSFEPISGKPGMEVTGFRAVTPQDNLIVKAYDLLNEHYPTPRAFRCHLEKNIPLGGGLGGGSSNAATTLIALNYLLDLGLKSAELQTLGLKLGADVPFFIAGQSARVTGIGETITPITLPRRYFVILYPNIELSTRLIFQNLILTHEDCPRIMDNLHEEGGDNDLKATAFKLFPKLAEFEARLRPFGDPQMTGSGSCLFIETASRKEAERVKDALSPEATVFSVETLNASPMLQFMK